MRQQWVYWGAGIAALLLLVAARIGLRDRALAWRAGRLRPGTVLWAMVPFADGVGQKDRPCLVLGSQGRSLAVLKMTTRNKAHRRDHLALGIGTWDRQRRQSWLDCSQVLYVDVLRVRRTTGRVSLEQLQAARRLAASLHGRA